MAKQVIKQLRDFPAVEQLLQSESIKAAVASVPRPLVTEVVQQVIAEFKEYFRKKSGEVTLSDVTREINARVEALSLQRIGKVINATGIVVHTNLGRAPLSEALFDAVKKTVVGYGNVEFDLETGARGSRGTACEKYLAILSGSESATVVNNCAAALMIILNTMANRRQVVISRGELVQIGGGFRIPDILKKSGARLCEVGTTNITTLADYEGAITDKTGLILRVHQSNFIQRGFTQQIELAPLVALGKKHDLPVVNDLGSGVFIPTRDILGYAEPTVQQSVRDGATVTCFSGDKMLGGCQAGLIVGGAEHIKRIKSNPLFRTIRVDKIVFSILEKMLGFYLDGQWQSEIKVWAILSVSESDLYRRGKQLLKNLGNPAGLSVEATRAYVGGGALPEAYIPSVGLVFSTDYKATRLLRLFREASVPVVGRIEDDRFILDLKAIDEADLKLVEKTTQKILRSLKVT